MKLNTKNLLLILCSVVVLFIIGVLALVISESSEGTEQNCLDGIASACYTEGAKYQFGDGVKVDYEKAAFYYDKACNENHANACNNLGALYKNPKNPNRDVAKSLKYHTKACDIKTSHCFGVAMIYAEGNGVPKNDEKAIELYTRACAKDNLGACNNLAVLLSKSSDPNVQQTVAEIYEKSCRRGQMLSCSNLGTLYLTGKGVKLSTYKAQKMFKKACSGKNQRACYELATMYVKAQAYVGPSISQKESFKQLYGKECNQKMDTQRCQNLKRVHDKAPAASAENMKKAGMLFEKACANGHVRACYGRGYVYAHGGVAEEDLNKAQVFYKKTCDKNYAPGCKSLAWAIKQTDPQRREVTDKRTGLFKKACTLGDKGSCEWLKKHAQ